LLRFLAVGLTFLWAVDAAEADAFRVLVVQNFDGVAVLDGDDRDNLASRLISGARVSTRRIMRLDRRSGYLRRVVWAQLSQQSLGGVLCGGSG
jgi:hypothetical protein